MWHAYGVALNPAKIFFNIAGTVCVALGVAGIVLPLLPATPFFLLASACYFRGSDRLHAWLINHPYMGPYIRNFRDHRGMPRRAKVYTLVLLWLSIGFSIWMVGFLPIRIMLVVIATVATTVILKMRTIEVVDSQG